MGNGSRTQARRVLLRHVAPAYHQASRSQKQHILEEFVNATGYAANTLSGCSIMSRRSLRHQQPFVGDMSRRLKRHWCWSPKTLNRICTKRLIPFLPDMLETLEEQGHIQLSQEHRSQLLSMSATTAERKESRESCESMFLAFHLLLILYFASFARSRNS